MREAKIREDVRELRELVRLLDRDQPLSREHRIRPITSASQCDRAVRRLNRLRRSEATNPEYRALQMTIRLYIDGVRWNWRLAEPEKIDQRAINCNSDGTRRACSRWPR